VPTICIAQDDAADDPFGCDPLALLSGMPLDQHMPDERVAPRPDQAFGSCTSGPFTQDAVTGAPRP
jgi:hypothetical protein